MSYNGDLYPNNAEAVMSTKGDMVDFDTQRQRLGIGSANQILQVKSSLPSWETVDLADTVLTTAGDVLIENATPELARLAAGTQYNNLQMGATLPAWSASSTSTMTAAQDILYSSSANTLARLAAGADGKVLTTHSTGSAPTWETAAGGDYELLEEYTAGVAASVHNFTGSWDLADDYTKLVIEIDMKPTVGFLFGMHCNNQTSGNYWGKIIRNGTTLTGATGGGSNILDLMGLAENPTGAYTFGTIEISSMRIHQGYLVQSRLSGTSSYETYASGYAPLGDPVITDIELFSNTGSPKETWDAGTEFTLYGVKRS